MIIFAKYAIEMGKIAKIWTFRANRITFRVTETTFRVTEITFRVTEITFRVTEITFRVTGTTFRVTGMLNLDKISIEILNFFVKWYILCITLINNQIIYKNSIIEN